MKSTLQTLALVIATGSTAAGGCAHSWNASDGHQEARGSLHLASNGARLLVTGPASQVHADVGDGRAVSLFMANAVNGDDADCAAPALAMRVATESVRRLRVPEGQVLCAVAATPTLSSAPTELLWHAHRERIAHPLALQ